MQIVFTSVGYIKLDHLYNTFYDTNDPIFMYPTLVNAIARHALRDKRFNLMYSIDVNTMGSQSVHSIL